MTDGGTVGPELQFGHLMGHAFDEQVVLIKTAIGNRALGFDFRPPSSGRTDPKNKFESLEYKLMVDGVQTRDIPLVQACGMIFRCTYVVLILIADIASIASNPRLRHPK